MGLNLSIGTSCKLQEHYNQQGCVPAMLGNARQLQLPHSDGNGRQILEHAEYKYTWKCETNTVDPVEMLGCKKCSLE